MTKQEFLSKLSAALDEKFSLEDLMFASTLSHISLTIASKRISMGMNQQEFAEFMEVSQALVSKWESGNCNFTLESMVKIACKLDMEVSDLLVKHDVDNQYDSIAQPAMEVGAKVTKNNLLYLWNQVDAKGVVACGA